jgi:hypothetical protein
LFQDPRKICGKNLRHETSPGLPDGFFSNQKSQFGYILEGPRLENVDTFYGHLEYFTDIWDILGPFGTFCDNLVHFFQFWYVVSRKLWQPCCQFGSCSTCTVLCERLPCFRKSFICIGMCFANGEIKKGHMYVHVSLLLLDALHQSCKKGV